MIFVDTGAWYASVMPSDPNHAAASQWLLANQIPLLTTDYVIDETLTLLKARGHSARAIALGQELFGKQKDCIHYLLPDEIDEAWQTFCRFSDKDWSFTDCTSKVVMEKRGIVTAFAFDRHFRQFGMVSVVP